MPTLHKRRHKMNKITLSTTSIMIMTIGINANILTNAFENATVNGYVRAGYEVHHVENVDTFKDGANVGEDTAKHESVC